MYAGRSSQSSANRRLGRAREEHAERPAPVRGLRSVRGGPHRAARDARSPPGCCRSSSCSTTRGPSGIDADDGARPRRRPPRRRPRPRRPRSGRCRRRPVHDTAFVSGSIRDERPVVAVDDPHRALADGHRARAVADRDRLHHAAACAGRSASPCPPPRSPPTARPAPAAIALGFAPTAIGESRRPRSRSMLRMRPSTPDATHTAPAANGQRARRVADRRSAARTLSAPGIDLRDHARRRCRPPTATRRRTRAPRARRRPGSSPTSSPSRSMRETVPSAALAIHTEPPPSVTALGPSPTGYLLRDAAARPGRSARRSSRRCPRAPRARARG